MRPDPQQPHPQIQLGVRPAEDGKVSILGWFQTIDLCFDPEALHQRCFPQDHPDLAESEK